MIRMPRMLYTRLMDDAADRGATEEQLQLDASGVVRRIAAFDVGERRIGVAVSDALGYTAQPLLTIYCKTAKADLKSIGRILRRHDISEVVIGNPLHMSGEVSARARKAQELAERLRTEFGVPVHLVDERLTTWEAHRLLDESGHSRRTTVGRRERKQIIDQVAAVLILRAFMEGRANEAERDRAELE